MDATSRSAEPAVVAPRQSGVRETLPVIKLSADFLKMLKMDVAAAYALSPAFACRLERFTNQGVWVPRALVITTEGILRLFDCASGRITHAMDLVHVCHDDSMDLDAPPATVHCYSHIQLTIDARPVEEVVQLGAARDRSHHQCVRLVARCPMRLSVDEMMMRSGANKASGGVVTFEEDILLRFRCNTASAPGAASVNLAQSFLGALRHFCAQREVAVGNQQGAASYSMGRSQESLQTVVERAMQENAVIEATTSPADRNVRHRKKPNRLASTLNVFKREISSIRALGVHEKRGVEAAGGTIVEPPSSPRRLGDVDVVLPTTAAVPDGEGDASDRPVPAKSDGGPSMPHRQGLKQELGGSEEDLMKILAQPKLLTISLSAQRTARIPAIFIDLLKEQHNELRRARRLNLERLSRLKLLKDHAQLIHEHQQQEADLTRLMERTWLDFVDDVMVPYSHAKVEVAEAFSRTLTVPLPQFDDHLFQENLLEAMDRRDDLQEELEKLEVDLQTAERSLAVELRDDPVRLTAANESAQVVERLQLLQETLRQRRTKIAQAVETAKAKQTVECEDVLMDQEKELQRLRGLLKSKRAVYVLHEELIRNVPSSGQASECNSLSAAGRRLRMNLDV